MLPKGKKKSLTEEINKLMTTKQTNFDSDEDELTKAKTVERDDSDISEDEYQTSSIRKKTAPLLADEDERYAGKKISRKAAFGNESEDELSEELSDEELISEDDESISGSDKKSQSPLESSDNSDNDSQSDFDEDFKENDDDEEEEEEEVSDEENSFQGETGIKIISDTNLNSEVEKGRCVKNQLERWEKLLKTRILMQKCLAISNEMPQHDVHETFMSNSENKELKAKTISEVSKLLDNLLELQNNFLETTSEIKRFSSKDKKRNSEEDEEITSDEDMNEEIPSNSEDDSAQDSEEDSETEIKKPVKRRKLNDYETIISQNHKQFLQFRNSVIQKFDDKTKISSGKSNKGTQNQSVLKQIEFVLNDREKLMKRTQLKRSNYKTLGKANIIEMDQDGRHVQDYDPEIFDDDDFYQQLLREVIESKCAENTDPVQLSRQWAQLQNMRSKMKRNIDTRATKGRRIRYVVHQKLVNFMAPITYNDTWTDSAKNELYNSIFGDSPEVGSTLNGIVTVGAYVKRRRDFSKVY